ncbi:MAG: hypothetical protein HOQ21_09965 [Dermatophilaceae bacterium]|nr:hypothetical protein [Dermatophilaceae bacterium]
MRALLRLLALLAGFFALPTVVAAAGNSFGFTALECVLAGLCSLPLSGMVTTAVRASFAKARRDVAEVQAS